MSKHFWIYIEVEQEKRVQPKLKRSNPTASISTFPNERSNTHRERERRSLTTILFFNDTLNVTKNMSCKSKTADEFMSKNRHQILVHEYPYSHSIIPVKASPNHKACQVWMKYAKWNYCGWVLSYWEIQHRESLRTSRSKREIRIRNVITCIFTLDLLLHHGEMSAYKKPIYFSLQANGKLFAKM